MPSAANTPAAESDAPSHEALLASLDIALTPRPFRHPAWKPSPRRNKNVKQILGEAARREASMLATQTNSGVATPSGAGSAANPPEDLAKLVLERSLKAGLTANAGSSASVAGSAAGGPAAAGPPGVTYTNIESAPSLHPAHQRPYCDVTGLPAPYTDPKTRLRYHNREVFGVVRGLPQGTAERYLEARGAHVVLK